jgi:hypothetical protein
MAGCSDSATSWRLFDSNIDIFYWVQPIRRRRKMVTVAKATTLPRTRVRLVIAGASYFRIAPHCNRLFRICDITHPTRDFYIFG